MKRKCLSGITFSIIILPFFFSVLSCKKNNNLHGTGHGSPDNIEALQQAIATSFGVTTDKVVYSAGSKEFIVDGDGIVSLEDARLRFADGSERPSGVNETTQRKYCYVVASTKVKAIKIFADATVPASWLAALNTAIANWNTSGSKVHMQRTTTALGANTFITTNYSSSNYVASASYPDSYGNAGRKVYINTYYNYISDLKKIYAMTHELGHTIGLMHTNETSGTLIKGTLVSDTYSVMNSTCSNWLGFSLYDLTAVRSLYPLL